MTRAPSCWPCCSTAKVLTPVVAGLVSQITIVLNTGNSQPAGEGELWAGWQEDCFLKSCGDVLSSRPVRYLKPTEMV